ncbi:MAG: hypothetical protein JOZ80_04050 [Acidobacteriaceae bacterium]|nr:hypothetical protein [Acidobacteriaceae bacterium]
MLTLSRMGAVMIPPVTAFYNQPKTLAEVIDHLLYRVLDQFGIESPAAIRWNGLRTDRQHASRRRTPLEVRSYEADQSGAQPIL